MALFRTRVTLLTGAVNVNALQGSKFEFLSRPAVVSLWATQSVAPPGIEIDFTLGNVVVGEDMIPNLDAAELVQRDRDGLGSGVGDAGDRIQLRVRNSNALTVIASLLVDISEIA